MRAYKRIHVYSVHDNYSVKVCKTSTSVFGDWPLSTHADPTSTRRANLIGMWVTTA